MAPPTGNFGIVLSAQTIDLNSLAEAVGRIIERHEALRTTFCLAPGPARFHALRLECARRSGLFIPGFVLQRARDAEPIALTEVDHRAEEVTLRRLTEIVGRQVSAPFDIEHGPLVRCILVRTANQDYAVLVLSHFLVDGWAAQILRQELDAAYDAIVRGTPLDLPAVVSSPRDFALREHRAICHGEMSASIDYWAKAWSCYQNGLLTESDVETWRPTTTKSSRRVEVVAVRLSVEGIAIRAYAKARRLSLYVVLRAAFAATLRQVLGKQQVVFAANFVNRMSPFANLVGWTANTHMLLTDMSDDPTADSLCQRVSEDVRLAMRHSSLPLPALWQALGKRLIDGAVAIGFDAAGVTSSVGDGKQLRTVPVPGLWDWANLHFRYRADRDNVIVTATYDPSQYDGAKILALLEGLRRTAYSMSVRPDVRVSRIAPVSGSTIQPC